MANKARGETKLNISGKEVVFYLKIKDLAEIEDQGVTIVKFQQQLSDGLIGTAVRTASVVLSIASHGELSKDNVTDWYDDVGLEVFIASFNKVFELAFNGMSEKKKSPETHEGDTEKEDPTKKK